jgi:hypothetical protein
VKKEASKNGGLDREVPSRCRVHLALAAGRFTGQASAGALHAALRGGR